MAPSKRTISVALLGNKRWLVVDFSAYLLEFVINVKIFKKSTTL